MSKITKISDLHRCHKKIMVEKDKEIERLKERVNLQHKRIVLLGNVNDEKNEEIKQLKNAITNKAEIAILEADRDHVDIERLNRLADELIENIINTSDRDILKEVEEDYGDSSFVANRVREILKKSQVKAGIQHKKDKENDLLKKPINVKSKAYLMLQKIEEHFKYHHYFTIEDFEKMKREERQADIRRKMIEDDIGMMFDFIDLPLY